MSASIINDTTNCVTIVKTEVDLDELEFFGGEENNYDDYSKDPLADDRQPNCDSEPVVEQKVVVKIEKDAPLPVPVPQQEGNKFKCEICGLEVARVNSLKRHHKRFHDPTRVMAKRGRPRLENWTLLKCSQCDKAFTLESSLKAHEITHRAIPVTNLLPKIAAGVVLQKKVQEPEKPKCKVKSVNVKDAKAVAKVLKNRSVDVKLTKVGLPPKIKKGK